MKYALWTVQILLALVFVAVGFTKAVMPMEQLVANPNLTWVSDIPVWLVRFIGLAELAGGVGLILPALSRIQPWLTTLAAGSLALLMLLGALFHLGRGETSMMAPALLLLALSAFVAYGRWKLAPIASKNAALNLNPQ